MAVREEAVDHEYGFPLLLSRLSNNSFPIISDAPLHIKGTNPYSTVIGPTTFRLFLQPP